MCLPADVWEEKMNRDSVKNMHKKGGGEKELSVEIVYISPELRYLNKNDEYKIYCARACLCV